MHISQGVIFRGQASTAEQKHHAVCVSISLTSREVMTPFVVRITGKPSSAVAMVKRSGSSLTGTTTKTFVLRKMDRVTDLYLAVLDRRFESRGFRGLYFTRAPDWSIQLQLIKYSRKL